MAEIRRKIGEILVSAGVIDEMQLKSALGYQKRWGGKLGKTLVEMGFIDEDTMIKFLAEHFHMRAVNLLRSRIAAKAFEVLPQHVAEKYNVVPVMVREVGNKKMLVLAMSDPDNLGAIDEIQFLTNAKIEPVLATDSAISRIIATYGNWNPDPDEEKRTQEYATPAQLKKQSGPPKPTAEAPMSKTGIIRQAARQIDEEIFDFGDDDDLEVVKGEVTMLKAMGAKKPAPPRREPPRQSQPAAPQRPSPNQSPFLGHGEQEEDEEEILELVETEGKDVSGEHQPVISAPPIKKAPATPAPPREAPPIKKAPATPAPSREAPPIKSAPATPAPSREAQPIKSAPAKAPPPRAPSREATPIKEAPVIQAPSLEIPSIDDAPSLDDVPAAGENFFVPPSSAPESVEDEQKPVAHPPPIEIPDEEEGDNDIVLADAHEFISPVSYEDQSQSVDAGDEEAGELELASPHEFLQPAAVSPGPEPDMEKLELADAHEFLSPSATQDAEAPPLAEPEDEWAPPLPDDFLSPVESGPASPGPTPSVEAPSFDDFPPLDEMTPASSAPPTQAPSLDDDLPPLFEEEPASQAPAPFAADDEPTDLPPSLFEDERKISPTAPPPAAAPPDLDFPPPLFDERETGPDKPSPPAPKDSDPFSEFEPPPLLEEPTAMPARETAPLEPAPSGPGEKIGALPFEAPPPDIGEPPAPPPGEHLGPSAEPAFPPDLTDDDFFGSPPAPPSPDAFGSSEMEPFDELDSLMSQGENAGATANDISFPPIFTDEAAPPAGLPDIRETEEDDLWGALAGPPLPPPNTVTPAPVTGKDEDFFAPGPPPFEEAAEDKNVFAEEKESQASPEPPAPPPPPEIPPPPEPEFNLPVPGFEAPEPPAPQVTWREPPPEEASAAGPPPEPPSVPPPPPPPAALKPLSVPRPASPVKSEEGLGFLVEEIRKVAAAPDESPGLETTRDALDKLSDFGDEFLDTRELKQRLQSIHNLEQTLTSREQQFDQLLSLMMKKEMGEVTREIFMKELIELKRQVDEEREKKPR